MGPLDEARAHLTKAAQYLTAAELGIDEELYDPATSAAVHCGINAKDAVCLRLTGRTGKTDDHHQAAAELERAGPQAAAMAPTLRRLLALKQRAEYRSAPTSSTDATKAVELARRLHATARVILTS